MTKTVDFIFDVGSPNAYLAHKALPDITARTGAEFKYIAVLLGGIFKLTNNMSPVMAFGNVKGKLAYHRLEIRRFIRDHNVGAFKMNPHFPVNTLSLMRGAVLAEQDGRSADYNAMAFAAMWELGLKMDAPDVLARHLAAHGFDDYLERIKSGAVKSVLAENTQAAVDRGVFGAPSFFVGDEMFFGKDSLAVLEAEILR